MPDMKTRRVRPPIKRHGGKAYLASHIIALMPSHQTYVEPFLGGGSVLLNKPKAEREIAGDLDAGLIGMWQVLKLVPLALIPLLRAVDYQEASFDLAIECAEEFPASSAAGATNYIVRNRFSRGGLGETFAWSDRLRGGQPEQLNSWDTIRAELPDIAERVRDVKFHCCRAVDLIERNDAADTLVYADPPYHHGTRTAKSAYEHEMTHDDHVDLLHHLCRIRSMVAISGYRCDLYDSALAGWERHEFSMPNHSGQGKTKQRRIECLWIKA